MRPINWKVFGYCVFWWGVALAATWWLAHWSDDCEKSGGRVTFRGRQLYCEEPGER